MQKNKLLYLSVGILLAALLIFFILYMGIGFEFNTTTHAEWEQNGIVFTYKGSKKEIRKLEISREGKELLAVELSASPSLFSNEDSKSAIIIDSEQENTIMLLPYSLDDDNDKHYRSLCLCADGSALFDTEVDLINPNINGETGDIYCESTSHETVGKALDDLAAPYEESTVLTVYQIDEKKLVAIYQLSVTYYSENNVYCVSRSDFDYELLELGNSIDDWLSPEEYANMYDILDSVFTAPLPIKRP